MLTKDKIAKQSSKDSSGQPAASGKFQFPWKRLSVGALFLGLGGLALAVGTSSIGYRLTHLVTDQGLLNGRIVRLRSPIDGSISAFYARPGAQVKLDQVLARVERSNQAEQALLQLEGDLQSKSNQLSAAIQTQASLQSQLQNLEAQSSAVWTVGDDLAATDLSEQEAAVEGAMAKARAAQLNYQRYQQLLAEGVVSRQVVDQFKSDWDVAEAAVRQAQATLRSAQSELNASRSRTLISQSPMLANSLVQQSTQLRQQIEAQSASIQTLTAERSSIQKQLEQARSLYSDRQDLEVAAPFSGVVYRTERERNEQVNQSEPILTLLDCNDLWVEVVLPAQEASQIDPQKPVQVRLSASSEMIRGEVDLIQPISSSQAGSDPASQTQVQALPSLIPTNLVGQPLTRVTVRIPPPPDTTASQQFCGVGQLTQLAFGKKPFGIR